MENAHERQIFNVVKVIEVIISAALKSSIVFGRLQVLIKQTSEQRVEAEQTDGITLGFDTSNDSVFIELPQ